MGTQELQKQLADLGIESKAINGQFVQFKFTIPVGRFVGQTVELALQAPQFPLNPPPGPHISPLLLPFAKGNKPPTDGIHASPMGSTWQYWSRPFKGWATTDRDMKTYLAFLRTIFDFE